MKPVIEGFMYICMTDHCTFNCLFEKTAIEHSKNKGHAIKRINRVDFK